VRVVFLGGTRFLGPVTVRKLVAAGHAVAVAHTGTHESVDLPAVEHLHGARADLLTAGGPVERSRPDVLVDTFAGGATREKAREVAACGLRVGAARLVAISSMDVYQHCVEAGLGDGGGVVPFSVDPVPLTEDARLRPAPYPGAAPGHDNAAMEHELTRSGVEAMTVLRPGTIYGQHATTREWTFVERVHRGERRLPLPDGGVQLFHRVAVERVADAVVASLTRAPSGWWACNVVDPHDWDYSGLARLVASELGWEWEAETVPFEEGPHPWHTSHPVLCSDVRLQTTLGVQAPDPETATRATVRWLWEHRERLAAG
jgi:nucleoside-diphosphate-sugar epimerase